jgi:hypothetical protein
MTASWNPTDEPKPSFIRPEVAALNDASFVMCGLLCCIRCGDCPQVDTGAPQCSELHYYRVAEWAHDRGWIPDATEEYAVLCGRCAAQQGAAADDRPQAGDRG